MRWQYLGVLEADEVFKIVNSGMILDSTFYMDRLEAYAWSRYLQRNGSLEDSWNQFVTEQYFVLDQGNSFSAPEILGSAAFGKFVCAQSEFDTYLRKQMTLLNPYTNIDTNLYPIAAFPTSDANAFAVNVPQADQFISNDDHGKIILVNLKLVGLFGHLLDYQVKILDGLLDEKEAYKQILQTVLHYLSYGLYGNLWMPVKRWYSNELVDEASRFIIAHELTHITLGHLATDTKTIVKLDPFGASGVSYLSEWDDEFEADFGALKILQMQHGRSTNLAIYMFLVSMELIEGVRASFYSWDRMGSTHPPAHLRLERLRSVIGSPRNYSWPTSFVKLGNDFEKVCQEASNLL
jgi:hypothetical protein